MYGIRKWFFLILFGFCVAGISSDATSQATYYKPNTTPWEEADYPFIIELFTSTDCAGCIMADTKLYELSLQENVIALSCHVNGFTGKRGYQTELADECFNRQWYYNQDHFYDKGALYTPQIVVNGGYPFAATNERRVDSYLWSNHTSTGKPHWIHMSLTEDGKMNLKLPEGTEPQKRNGHSHAVWLIRYHDSAVIKIEPEDGEGKSLVVRYTNIIQKTKHVGKWYGIQRDMDIDLSPFVQADNPGFKHGGWVAMIQRTSGGDVIAAGKLSDPKRSSAQPTE